MTQTYSHPASLKWMRQGLCPECGKTPEDHIDDPRFWIPRLCDLLPHGVHERIAKQREMDMEQTT